MGKRQNEQTTRELDGWLTTEEAAQLVGKSTRRIRQLVKDGVIEARLVTPRLYLVSLESVERYLRDE